VSGAETVISAKNLLTALQRVSGVVERKQTFPILSHVLVEGRSRTLQLTGTDLEIEITSQLTLECDSPDFALTLPARKLIDICRLLPEDATLSITLEKERAVLVTSSGRYTLGTLKVADFPKITCADSDWQQAFSAGELLTLLEHTQFAIASNDVRYYLTGLLLEFDRNQTTAVATDGHRLAVANCSHEQAINASKQQLIVPRKAISEMMRILSDEMGEIQLSRDAQHLCVQTPKCTLVTKLIASQYPPYQQVIPRQNNHVLLLDRDLFKQALNRVAILSEEHKGIFLELSTNQLRVSADNPQLEYAEEVIPIDYNDADFLIVINAHYLLDVLNALPPGQISLKLTDAHTGILIESEERSDLLYVIMPMQP
jgi:DNA polymerase-3 subunit beta